MGSLGYPAVAIIVIGTGIVAGGLAWLTRRWVHIDVLRRHHEIGSAVFLQIGVMFAVLLAFVFSEVWGEYNTAAGAIEQECSALNGVALLSAALPAQPRERMKALLGAYTASVIGQEFRLMASRQESGEAKVAFHTLWLGAAAVQPEHGQEAMQNSILTLLSQAHENRNIRLYQMDRGLPALIWLLLLSLAVVLVGFLLFFGVEYIGSQMLFTAVFAASLAFILVLVALLDFPFEGVLSLKSSSFEGTAQNVAALR